ncbi:MAG: hypothetical protein D6767_05140, partial [Candidatus Hydrogenedentota bacterium]
MIFFEKEKAYEALRYTVTNAKTVRIASAFLDPLGFELLIPFLEKKQVKLLVGRKEGGKDKAKEFILDFMEELAQAPIREKTQLVKKIISALKNQTLFCAVNTSPFTLEAKYRFLHAKVYIADDQKALITSANVSRQGLLQAIEAGYVVEQKPEIKYLIEKYDEYFQEAVSIADELLEKLLEFLNAHDPWEVYARSLLAVYGMPDTETTALPQPADYQVPVIARALQNIRELNGCYLVAATGLGKTIIAGHVVAALFQARGIRAVTIFCPAGLREMWRRTMRMAGISSVEFSYHTLSAENPETDKNVVILDHELKNMDSSHLIILDESHNLRNPEERKNEEKLRNKRIKQAVQAGCKILMLTATPFSRGIEDVNAQLNLLPIPETKWEFGKPEHTINKISSVKELSNLPNAIVLTGPTVVKHFSRKDENGNLYILFGEHQKRYFPQELRIRNIEYHNPYDDFFAGLLEQNLLRVQDKNQSAFLFEDEVLLGKNLGGFNAQLLPQICSSSAQVKQLMENLHNATGYQNIR